MNDPTALMPNHRRYAAVIPIRISRAKKMSSSSNAVRIKLFLVLSLLVLVDIGPVPFTALAGLYIVTTRPKWFKDLIISIYDN